MAQRFKDENKKINEEVLIQTYRGKNLFVLSELLDFYLQLGYEIRNIRMATQYLGENCMAPFINKVTQMRIEATNEGDDSKANTAKLMGNSSYGKLLQNPSKYKRCLLVEDDKLYYYIRKPNFNGHISLETETGKYIYTYIFVYVRVYIRICKRIYTYMYAYIYVYVCVYIYVYVCVYI